MDRNKVVLVDEDDQAIDVMDKLAAHEQGQLHRAFSVFIFNDQNQLLLQQRADHKYHGAGLWANTCCSHPQWEEDVAASARERLNYEMGIDCDLKWVYAFIYKEQVENNLIEHELDHVFIGHSNAQPTIHEEEVRDYKWMHVEDILADMEANPSHYTVWFRQALPTLAAKMKES